MTVVCKVGQCPYISKNGFCRNRVLAITPNGLCGHIYDKNGQIRKNWQQKIDEMYMDGYKPKEKTELIQQEKEEKE